MREKKLRWIKFAPPHCDARSGPLDARMHAHAVAARSAPAQRLPQPLPLGVRQPGQRGGELDPQPHVEVAAAGGVRGAGHALARQAQDLACGVGDGWFGGWVVLSWAGWLRNPEPASASQQSRPTQPPTVNRQPPLTRLRDRVLWQRNLQRPPVQPSQAHASARQRRHQRYGNECQQVVADAAVHLVYCLADHHRDGCFCC